MTTDRFFSIFYGHQFFSDQELSSRMRRAVQQASKSAQLSWNRYRSTVPIKLSLQSTIITTGSDLFSEVLNKIAACDVCIFNLTEKNANVIFELGYAHGQDKNAIWISNESAPLSDLPSDFQGRFILRYSDEGELEQLLEDEIIKRVESLVKIDEKRDAFAEIWNMHSFSRVDLVFGALPAGERSKYGRFGEKNYLRYQNFADVDTFVFLTRFLARNFPAMEPRDFVSDEYAKEVDSPTLLIGGPFWNRSARRFYSFPEEVSPLAKVPVFFREGAEGEDDSICFPQIQQELAPVDDQEGFIDVGFFAKFPHPETEFPVVIMSGCRTAGVLGAARCFADDTELGKKNSKWWPRVIEIWESFLQRLEYLFGTELFMFLIYRVRRLYTLMRFKKRRAHCCEANTCTFKTCRENSQI